MSKSCCTDRFSELSEDVIHHIMSKLPTLEATRMSTLSKRFHCVFLSFPSIHMDFSLFASKNPQSFCDFVRDNLQRTQTKILERLSFEGFPAGARYKSHVGLFAETLERVLDFAAADRNNKYLKELSLSGSGITLAPSLCLNALAAHSNIKTLKLSYIKLRPHGLVLDYPSLEDLSLTRCSGLRSLEISIRAKRVRSVKLLDCPDLASVLVNVAADTPLKSFSCSYDPRYRNLIPCGVTLNSASQKSLELLELGCFVITEEWIRRNTGGLVSLEDLRLSWVRFKLAVPVKVSFESLKSLALSSCTSSPLPVEIEAPNLGLLNYRIEELREAYLDHPPVHLAHPNPLLKVKVDRFFLDNCRTIINDDLIPFIGSFGYCNTLSMTLFSEADSKLANPYREHIPPLLSAVKHLEITTGGKICYYAVDLVDTFLGLGPHLESISFYTLYRPFSHSRQEAAAFKIKEAAAFKIKLFYSTTVASQDSCRHCLSQVTLENFTEWDYCLELKEYFTENATHAINIIII